MGGQGVIHWEGLELSEGERVFPSGGTGPLVLRQQSSMALVIPRVRRTG